MFMVIEYKNILGISYKRGTYIFYDALQESC